MVERQLTRPSPCTTARYHSLDRGPVGVRHERLVDIRGSCSSVPGGTIVPCSPSVVARSRLQYQLASPFAVVSWNHIRRHTDTSTSLDDTRGILDHSRCDSDN